MSARDDYPPIPNGVNRPGGWGLLHLRMCDEIDRLRTELAHHTTPRCPTCHQQCDRTRCDCGPDCDTAEHQETTR